MPDARTLNWRFIVPDEPVGLLLLAVGDESTDSAVPASRDRAGDSPVLASAPFPAIAAADLAAWTGHGGRRESARLLDIAMRFMFPAWQVRLIYTRSQLYTVRRQDGAVLSVFLLREGNDATGVQRFFEEFSQVRGT